MYLLAATPAVAAEEFAKTGNGIKTTGGEAIFVFSSVSLSCESSSGKGKVASTKLIKAEVTFEKCTSTLGAAKVTTCAFSFSPSGTMTIESGCKIESAGCIVEPALAENQTKVAHYVNVNEKESELESEIIVDAGGLTYKVNSVCELDGVKGGKEGELDSVAPLDAQGVAAQPARKIFVKEAAAGATRTLTLENTNSHVITFLNGSTITCGGVVFSGTTPIDESPSRAFKELSYTNCTTDILGGSQVIKVEAEAGTGCEYVLYVPTGPLATPQPGGGGIHPNTCQIKAVIMSCTITFRGDQSDPGIALTNNGGTPKKVTVKFSAPAPNLYHYIYRASANCGTVAAGPAGATYKGESKLKATITSNGSAADVEVK